MDTTLKQSSQVETKPSIPKKFSLYVNGQNLQANTHYIFYKEDILMLPVGSIGMVLGYQVEYNHKDNHTIIYKTSCFESDAIIIRYSYIANDGLSFFYYSKGAEYFSIDIPPEVKGGELYAPAVFFEQALGCDIAVTQNSNITVDSSK